MRHFCKNFIFVKNGENYFIINACTGLVPQEGRTGVTTTARGGKEKTDRRRSELLIVLVTIIQHTRYIGCGIELRQLLANTDLCWIVAGNDGPEPDTGSEPEVKKTNA